MKYLVLYGITLGLGLTLPAVAHSQTLQRHRFPTQQAQSSPGSRYSRLSLGYPTPITDQYGVTGVTPNIQEWYNRVLAKMRSTPASSEVPQPAPLQLTAPEPERLQEPGDRTQPGFNPPNRGAPPFGSGSNGDTSPNRQAPGSTGSGGARGGEFTPQDRGAPGSGGAGGARFRPPSIPKIPD